MKTLTERYGTIGWDEFLATKKGILNDYFLVKEITKNRPVKTEHGHAGEAKFRTWLSMFLPSKFGVTSGYIIPDVRQIDYTLRHYDVIIYDKNESPTLWEETHSGKSEQGKKRAIPAKHVLSVLEVKSSLNKKSITDAKLKLKELNECHELLHKSFSSGIVFFEIHPSTQEKCKLGELLYDDDVYKYWGGLILNANGLDEKISGYYEFTNQPNTEESMLFVKESGSLQVNDKNQPVLTEQGDCCTIVALEGKWNFDKGYSPIIRNVNLIWSYNSFPRFAMDLLDRINGVYDKESDKKNYYGQSFYRI